MGTPLSSAGADDLDAAAILKTEAMLRILKGRTTAEQEAARLQVDAVTVSTWLESTFRAINRALDENLLRSLDPDSRTTAGAPIAPARTRGSKAF